jgi:hypothetical protein
VNITEVINFTVEEILSEERHDKNEDGGIDTWYEEYDSEWIGSFYLQDLEDDKLNIDNLLNRLEEHKLIKKEFIHIEGDIIQFKIFEDAKPLYEVTLR